MRDDRMKIAVETARTIIVNAATATSKLMSPPDTSTLGSGGLAGVVSCIIGVVLSAVGLAGVVAGVVASWAGFVGVAVSVSLYASV
ncbi:MAG: hypothetical protein ACK4H7_01685 [Acidilobaceae archaeon]